MLIGEVVEENDRGLCWRPARRDWENQEETDYDIWDSGRASNPVRS
jgi:hypothetical protein